MFEFVDLMDSAKLDLLFNDLPPINADAIKDIRKEPIFVQFALSNLCWYVLQGNKFNINGEMNIEFLGYFYNASTGDLELTSFYLSDLKSVMALMDPSFSGCIDDVV